MYSGVARVMFLGGPDASEASKNGGPGACPREKFLGPRPVLWLRMHLPISYMQLALKNFDIFATVILTRNFKNLLYYDKTI